MTISYVVLQEATMAATTIDHIEHARSHKQQTTFSVDVDQPINDYEGARCQR